MIDFKQIEAETLKFWENEKIYEKVKSQNKDGKKFYFLQGPPYTSGKIHIGQAWNNSMKDIILRYKRMKGFNVWDRAGYDMHGLPTENAVQKKLGLKTKEDIIEYGVGKFVKKCLAFSEEHAEYMNQDLWKLGVWIDYENAYMPIKKEWIGGEWAFFKKAWEQKRLYRGEKVMHWDAETETSLAKHELEYETIKDTSVFLKFAKKNSDNEHFVIWTTTPWTIPFNLAIMVNPKVDYVKVEVDNEFWIVAKDLVGAFVSGLLGKKFEIVEEFKGNKLEGVEYVHPFYENLKEFYDELKNKWEKVHTIILNENYVDTSAGTGLVHCAPGCGPEDQEAGEECGIGTFNILNERGEFENLGKYSGWKAKEDDEKFIGEFENLGILVGKSEIEHEYPHSDRSHKPVVFRTTEQWFLKTKDLVKELVKYNDKVKWVPKKSGESYKRWAENLKDNGITRQRFWGCPVPIWVNVEDKEDFFVVGSLEELEKLTGKTYDDLSLHKPWIDKIVIEKKGKKYKRISDVADVWIDSGTASWNCLYNNPKLIKEWFPADLVLEATEQTRLWFSLLQICSAIRMGKSAYKNAFAHGMIFDFQGTKMSKSLGNIISPYEVIDKYSADILRNYICQISAGENISFNWEDIKVKQRNLMMLSNIANYILDLEKQNISKKGKSGIEEKWMISKYNSSLRRVSELFESYRLDETISEIENLFISLSRDYIKLTRNKSGKDAIVLKTIKEIYLEILKMFSTICPFLTEHLWGKMNQKGKSVHLCSWPKFSEKKINKKLEDEFESAMKVIEVGLRERDKKQTGLKWPLKKAVVQTDKAIGSELKEIIMRQLNIKDIEIKKSEGEINVELDIVLTPELEAEGFSREIARRVQSERKNRGMEKQDSIVLELLVDSELKESLKPHLDFVKERTGSEKISIVDKSEKEVVKFKVRNRELGISF